MLEPGELEESLGRVYTAPGFKGLPKALWVVCGGGEWTPNPGSRISGIFFAGQSSLVCREFFPAKCRGGWGLAPHMAFPVQP